MSRTLKYLLVALLWETVCMFSPVDQAGAQSKQQRVPDRNRAALQQPDMRVEQPSPELERILRNWERSSTQINKLQGEHDRFVYDLVFNTEKRATGVFYYEAPDKGRIDIEAVKIKEGAASLRKDPKTGQPFTLQSEQPEIWIANGENIMQIEQAKKQATIYEIPEDKRGRNIMDGPLPFLFGMPVEEAKRRFAFELVNESAGKRGEPIHLQVHPRWESDAANWQQAEIMLDTQTYLPRAVQLTDPTGNLITVYSFRSLVKNNEKRTVFDLFHDPFKYPLRGYAIKVQKPVDVAEQGNLQPGQNANRVPSVVGLSHVEAEEILVHKGYKVRKLRGEYTQNPSLLYRVQEQHPQPKMVANRGQEVTLILYHQDKPEKTRTTAKPGETSRK